MKIAVISTSVFPCPPTGYSGLEMIAYQTAKGLVGKGHQVRLIAPEGSSCAGAEIITSGPPGQWDERKAYSHYWQALRDVDVVIDETWNKWSYCGKAEGWLKAPVLGVMHAPVDTMYRVWPPAFPHLPPVERPCPVCISEDQGAHFRALHGRDVRICHNGVDVDYYQPLDVTRTSRFLFLARFSTVKSPDVCQLACRRAGVGLDLVGDTSITQEPDFLMNCARECDTSSIPGYHKVSTAPKDTDIRMVGPATRGETVWWYSQARAFLHLNSRFREPFGLAPVEAMMCGLPVLGWRYGALFETVKSGETGYLVSSLDEAVSVIRSGVLDAVDRRRCREWAAESFSVSRMVDRYNELVAEAVDTGGW